MQTIFTTLVIISLFIPQAIFAQGFSVQGAIGDLTDLVNQAIPIGSALAILVFFFGIARFIFSGGDEKNIEKGKRIMFWGVVALFVLFSIFGIINLIFNIFFDGPILFRIPLNPNP